MILTYRTNRFSQNLIASLACQPQVFQPFFRSIVQRRYGNTGIKDFSNGKFTAPSPESDHFLALVRAYSDMACGACGSELRYIKGTQDGAGKISYTFYFCDLCDVEWRLRKRKE